MFEHSAVISKHADSNQPRPRQLLLTQLGNSADGLYEPTERASNDTPVYKHATKDRWLHYTDESSSIEHKGKWWVSAEASIGKRSGFASLACPGGQLPGRVMQGQGSSEHAWAVAVAGQFQPQPNARAAALAPVVMSKIPALRAACSGVYEPTGRQQHGRPIYKHKTADAWLHWNGGKWLVSAAQSVGSMVGVLSLKSAALAPCHMPAAEQLWEWVVEGQWTACEDALIAPAPAPDANCNFLTSTYARAQMMQALQDFRARAKLRYPELAPEDTVGGGGTALAGSIYEDGHEEDGHGGAGNDDVPLLDDAAEDDITVLARHNIPVLGIPTACARLKVGHNQGTAGGNDDPLTAALAKWYRDSDLIQLLLSQHTATVERIRHELYVAALQDTMNAFDPTPLFTLGTSRQAPAVFHPFIVGCISKYLRNLTNCGTQMFFRHSHQMHLEQLEPWHV